jgi:MOSC domain-containing protein YiiM
MSQAELIGTVVSVFVGTKADGAASQPTDEIRIALEGVAGDRHFGFTRLAGGREPHYQRGTPMVNDRQVSIVSSEELARIAAAMKLEHVIPAWLGANICVSGVPSLSRIPPDSRLVFTDGTVLIVSRTNMPCLGPGEVIAAAVGNGMSASAFPKAALYLRGLVARPERPGIVRPGDVVRVRLPPVVSYTTDQPAAPAGPP